MDLFFFCFFFFFSKIYAKRDDFDFDKVNCPFLDGDVPRRASNGVIVVYISELIRFARVCDHVTDFNFSNRAMGIINFEKHFLIFMVDTMN